jgi:hypothetical protein
MQAQQGGRGCGASGPTELDSISGISRVIHAGTIRWWCARVIPDGGLAGWGSFRFKRAFAGPLGHRANGGDHSFIAAGGNLAPLLPLALQLIE